MSEQIEESIPDPTCPACGRYLSSEDGSCDECGAETSDYAEIKIYKLFRKWRAAQSRPRVTDAWRAGYETGLNAEKIGNEQGWLLDDGVMCVGLMCGGFGMVCYTDPQAIRFARSQDASNFHAALKQEDFGASVYKRLMPIAHSWTSRK